LSRQKTIQREIELRGRGLFTGATVKVRFKPAGPDSGITFVRRDQPEPVAVRAHISNLSKRARRTSLRNGTVSIETVEHCLAAAHGLGIDNLVVELDGDELPAGDGSAQTYVQALRQAGLSEQNAERRYLEVLETVRVTDGEAELVAWPAPGHELDIIYDLDYGPDSPLGRQTVRFTLRADVFEQQIAPARTFVTDAEARELQAAGLGQHLTYQDVLVIGPEGPIQNEYRFPDECARHKVLDLIGDLLLAGAFVCGRIYANKSGHQLNHELVRRLLEQHERRRMEGRLRGAPRLDIRTVQRVLPHRYPMLLIDRVVEIEEDRRAIGIKNVTINEPFFEGHYPRHPIMPGVLIIEAMAQLGGLLLSQKLEHTGKVAVLMSLDKVKFRRAVVPGDQLILEAHTRRVRARTGEVFCRAHVQGDLAAEAEIRFMLVDADTD